MPDDRERETRVDITPLERPRLGGDRSPLAVDVPARLAPKGFDPTKRPGHHRDRVAQYVVHMSGSGIVSKALDAGADVDEHCVHYYANKRGNDGKPRASSHYFIGYSGTIYWLTGERVYVYHVGVNAAERRMFRAGTWRTKNPPAGVKAINGKQARAVTAGALALWEDVWPEVASPLDLVLDGAATINDLSVASEMAPAGLPRGGGRFDPLPGLVLRPGTRYTEAQHRAVAQLAADIARRQAWPQGWAQRSSRRVTGHEDHDPFGRWGASGGEDPGALRTESRFDWDHVFELARGYV